MSEILRASYFPFTTMATPVIRILSHCFDRVTVYQPVGSMPSPSLRPWVDNGLLDIRTPFAGIVDQKLVSEGFANWKTWGSMHHVGDLAYYKEMGSALAPVAPLTPRLVSEIKDTSKKVKGKNHDHNLTVQLFLLLSQDFDQQSLDIQEQLSNIDVQKQALEDFFQIDSPEQGDSLESNALFSRPKEDLGLLMTKTRMIAWNHLFQKAPAPSSVLVTDSPAALDFLLEDQEEKLEVLHFSMPYPPHASEGFSLTALLAPLFRDLLTKPWDEQGQRQVEQARRQISAMTAPRSPLTKDLADATPTFVWHLVPNTVATDLLNRRCKKNQCLAEKGMEKNTVVGLIHMDSTGLTG